MNWIDFHLPVLLILLPLIGGVISIFLKWEHMAWLWTALISSLVMVGSGRLLYLLHRLQSMKTQDELIPSHISYLIGSWPRQWGIELRIDPLNIIFILVVSLMFFIVTVYARRSIASEIPGDRIHFFYSVWMLAITGLLGILVAGDAFNIYVLLEISSLTIYTLIAMGKERDPRALTASYRYLIQGSIGASFILLGIGYLLMITGTLNLQDMREQLLLLDDFSRNRTVMVASAFLMVGLGLKMALFPLHFWLPNAYAYAPSAVSALLAATATKVGVYMFFRFVFTVLDAGHRIYFVSIRDLIMICAGSGVLICSLMAIYQQNIKKMLAYSSVAQVGYIVLGLALNNEAGIAGSLVHVINHALIKGGMFMAVGAVTYRCGANMLSDFRGLGRQMPFTMAAFTAGGFGLIGFPLTAGFVSKWYLIRGAVEAGAWPVTVVILVGSLLALIYVWRIIETIYFMAPENPERSFKEAPLSMLLPTLLVIGASLYFGFDAMLTGSLAEQAARVMLSGGLP